MVQGDFWNKLKQRLREVSTAAADFTEEQALIGKLKFDILNMTRKVERKQREIGQRVCELSNESPRADVFDDGDIVRLIAEIEELDKQIMGKRDEIAKVADQVRSKRSKAESGEAGPAPKPEAKKPETYVKPPSSKPKTTKNAPKKKATTSKKKPAASAKSTRKPSAKKTVKDVKTEAKTDEKTKEK